MVSERSKRMRGMIVLILLVAITLISYSIKSIFQHWHQRTSETMNLSESLTLPKPQTFSLDNGLQVILIPDKRSPSAIFMVWYRVGSADEKSGKTGLAHFLEHLMFKGTEKIKVGEFSKIVAQEGGDLNAFTYYDYTAYYEEIDPSRLEKMMQLEADRMLNLRLDEKEVLHERNVVLEERRMRIDNDPYMLLYCDMTHQLYHGSSYQEDVIGSFKDISHLEREDALDFYKTYYAPNNAIIIVAGNVDETHLEALVKKYYGAMKPSHDLEKVRANRIAPKPLAQNEKIERQDARVHNTQILRMFLAPSTHQAGVHPSMAIHLMAFILGSGETSRLYKELVVNKGLVSDVSFNYDDSLMNAGALVFTTTLNPGVKPDDVLNAADSVFDHFIEKGPTAQELRRAQINTTAHFIYMSDSQARMAELYGSSLLTGLSLEDVENFPFLAQHVPQEAVRQAAQTYLKAPSVTGILSPKKAAAGA